MNQVTVNVDASKNSGKLDHLWRYIGYDECNYTYVPEGIELLNKFGSFSDAPYYVRTHFMFCTGNCLGTFKFGSTNVYTEDKDGNPIYNYEYYDKIIDTWLETGNKPFLELGFMPMDLVDTNYIKEVKDNWSAYNQYKDIGWTCPPSDYKKWSDFISNLAQHLKMKYGEEVNSWYFELWNEPDIFYWSGSAAEYCKLYDYTENALHKVLPNSRLSGPAVTGIFEEGHAIKFYKFFLNHCSQGANFCTGDKGTRLDFITFHVKGGGFPFSTRVEKEVPSVESLVKQVYLGTKIAVEYGYENLEIVLSECDPDGWAAGGVHDNANMIFRNTEYYASYVASTFEKIEKVATHFNMAIHPLSWAFIFPGERCFEGTRTFSTQGIDKSVFNLFKIYSQLGDEKLDFKSSGAESFEFLEDPLLSAKIAKPYSGENEPTDISGFAVKGRNGETQILIFSHNNDRDASGESEVTLIVDGLPDRKMQLQHYRIDGNHSNAFKTWKESGEPLFPAGEEYAKIKEKDGLEKIEADREILAENGSYRLSFTMPPHAVSFIEIK